jgi:hypothetical protein
MSGCVENPAARVHHPASVMARGRRSGPVPHGLVTHPPAPSAAPAAPAGPVPGTKPDENPTDESDPAEPDAPPAVMPSPVDDVDG